MIKNYYEVLGVPVNASFKEIKKRYHSLLHKFHPDKITGNHPDKITENLEKTRGIIEAYGILSNSEKRKKYNFQMGFIVESRATSFNFPQFQENNLDNFLQSYLNTIDVFA